MHKWKFFRAGGFDQVKLTSGADLAALDELDQKLWVALACPTTGLEFDAKTLALIDTDKDGRIRAPDIIAATKWAVSCLKNPDDLLKGSALLPLNAINDATAEGKQLLASARQILVNLGKKEAAEITVEDTSDTAKIFAQTHFNGDGIVPVDSAPDEETKAVLNDIIACYGSDLDRSGKPGVSQAKADMFFADAQAHADWWAKADGNVTVLPLDGSTAQAAATLKALKPKLDDYFARCRLAAFDARALNALNREEKEYLAFAAKDLTITSAEIAGFPLASIGPDKPLSLTDRVNPAWVDAVATFRSAVVQPVLKRADTLTEADWGLVTGKFAAYDVWFATKPPGAVDKLGPKRVREILAGGTKQKIAELIGKDKALEPEANAISVVEKLIRYHRDLYRLLNNFVSFRDFYGLRDKAVFQAGTLYLDQRSCELCLTVEDSGKHSVMGALSGTYLAYCDCVRKATSEKVQIVAAFTNGDSDNLMVGRNGIFYDRRGRDWDATIAKIVDNPISIRQAFWAPYKKAARIIQEQVAKRAAAADAAAVDKLSQPGLQAGKPAAPAVKVDPGLVAALSVGAAGIGGMIGGILSGFLGLKGLMPLGVVAIILIISGPSMLLAWLKLRKRNLGPLLDANGWAVNARAKINVPFGASLTRLAVLPAGAQRDLVDPFAEKKPSWKTWLTLIVIVGLGIAWWLGRLDRYLPMKARSITVLGVNAPAYMPPPPAAANPPTAPVNPAPAAAAPAPTPAPVAK
jgi:hypothetical protein